MTCDMGKYFYPILFSLKIFRKLKFTPEKDIADTDINLLNLCIFYYNLILLINANCETINKLLWKEEQKRFLFLCWILCLWLFRWRFIRTGLSSLLQHGKNIFYKVKVVLAREHAARSIHMLISSYFQTAQHLL